MTRGTAAVAARPQAAPTPVLRDLIGRVRVKRMTLALVLTAAILVYGNSLANGFVLDDGGVIVRNPLVTSPIDAWRAFASPYWPAAIGGGQYRPLGILSFALDWLISGGDPLWFHAMNLVWHAVATVLVWVLAAELLAPVAAGIAALLFAIHPVHVEAVANVVGRLEPMAATFVLAALLAHRRGNRSAPALFALALASKESAIVLLALTAANDLLLERDRRTVLRARRWLYAGYGVVTVAYTAVLLAVFHDGGFRISARALAGTTVMERLAMVLQVVPHYIRLLVAPAQLSSSYAPNVISPAVGVWAAMIGLLTLMVFGMATVAAARRRWMVMAFALVWMPMALAPVSNVLFSSGVVLAERTLYLASVGACLVAGATAERYLLQRPAMVAAAMASVVVGFSVRTWTRTPVWRDDRTYVLTLLEDHPESYEAHLTAGRVLKGANALPQAERELVLARRIYPRDSVVYHEAADVARRMQRVALASMLEDSARIARTLPLPTR